MDPSQQVAGVAAVFDLVADDYDQSEVAFFQPIADGLVEAAAPRPGEHALDIGCGRGAATTRLADAVGPAGRVTAFDLSTAMVAHTAALLGDRAEVFQRDARDPGLPERTYDVVVSSLVLFFIPDPAAALERWVRLVAPGGRIALATFGRSSASWERLDRLLVPAMPQLDPRNLGPDNPFASDEGMEQLLAGSGAEDIRTTRRRIPVDFADVESWHAWSRTVGQRVAWDRMDEEATRAVLEAAEPFIAARDGFWSEARYTVGTVPG